jgi:WD40 repeat protein
MQGQQNFDDDRVSSVAWSPDGTMLATGFFMGDILVWDVSGVLTEGERTAEVGA